MHRSNKDVLGICTAAPCATEKYIAKKWLCPQSTECFPLDFAYTGYYNTSGSLNNETTNGNFWSRTVNDSSNAYNLNFNSSNVNPQNNGNRGNGRSLRCTAKFFPAPDHRGILVLPPEMIYIRNREFDRRPILVCRVDRIFR